jgi:hypothetical protein
MATSDDSGVAFFIGPSMKGLYGVTNGPPEEGDK